MGKKDVRLRSSQALLATCTVKREEKVAAFGPILSMKAKSKLDMRSSLPHPNGTYNIQYMYPVKVEKRKKEKQFPPLLRQI